MIESQDNWNYSRSVLFGYAIPFYHVGLRATLPVTDKVSLAGYAVNGWNNGTEFNGKKTVRPRRHAEADGPADLGRHLHGRRRSRAGTPATSSTRRSPSPRPRS